MSLRRIARTSLVALLVGGMIAQGSVALGADPDTAGLVDPNTGQWYLRNEDGNTASFYYGNPGDLPFMGDWDCDGIDSPGLYRQSDGYVYLRNSNDQGVADNSFFFGNPGDIPLAGDFDNNGCDTVSIYRPTEGRVYVINELGDGDNGLGAADYAYYFGNPGDKPFTGDFDGDGTDTVGLHRESTGFVYFRNSNTQGVADFSFFYGDPGDRLVAGDWGIVDGADSVGIYRPSDAMYYLRYTNTAGTADEQFPYGSSQMLPVKGRFGAIAAIPDLALQTVATGMNQPLLATAPVGDSRLFVVERGGRIKIIKNGSVLATPFLDISSNVTTTGEWGLLGLAFHPNFASNGRFFVHYNAAGSGTTTIEEYFAGPASDVANPTPVRTILTRIQPFGNHNGGSLEFGLDGYLYFGFGDGGSQRDPNGEGQNPQTLLGSMIRLDIDGGTPYAIPPGNPYNGSNGQREIWAIGLRNPWRWSVDRLTGELYIADVGQNAWEEINVASPDPAGLNFGWDITEGAHCHQPSSGCNVSGLTLPVHEYNHSGGNNSITGGYVYRGNDIAGLNGTYFYGDWGSGRVYSFRYSGGVAIDHREWTGAFGTVSGLASFGQGGDGELYVLSLFGPSGGAVYKIVAS